LIEPKPRPRVVSAPHEVINLYDFSESELDEDQDGLAIEDIHATAKPMKKVKLSGNHTGGNKGKKKAAHAQPESSSDESEELLDLSSIKIDVQYNHGNGSTIEDLDLSLPWRHINTLWRNWAKVVDPAHQPDWGYKYQNALASKKLISFSDSQEKWQNVVSDIRQNH